jgi:hypothetical protein
MASTCRSHAIRFERCSFFSAHTPASSYGYTKMTARQRGNSVNCICMNARDQLRSGLTSLQGSTPHSAPLHTPISSSFINALFPDTLRSHQVLQERPYLLAKTIPAPPDRNEVLRSLISHHMRYSSTIQTLVVAYHVGC